MDISIVILNYKSKGFVMSCLKSIYEADFLLAYRQLNYEIIVVDNASDDNIGDILAWQYPEVIFIQNHDNRGMGAGNNVGMKRAKGDYVIVMNPDTIAFRETFKILFEFMENDKQIGVCGPRQLNPDKSIQSSCYRWPGLLIPLYRRTPLGKMPFAKKAISHYLMEDFDHQSERVVDWLLGSFLFIRRTAIAEIGLFDERYFMYFEDTDYCRRFWVKDWKVVYYPGAEIIHNHNRQSAKSSWYNFFSNRAAREHIISWIKYLYKWKWQKQVMK
jgi:GT2 family glycosyltransferase